MMAGSLVQQEPPPIIRAQERPSSEGAVHRPITAGAQSKRRVRWGQACRAWGSGPGAGYIWKAPEVGREVRVGLVAQGRGWGPRRGRIRGLWDPGEDGDRRGLHGSGMRVGGERQQALAEGPGSTATATAPIRAPVGLDFCWWHQVFPSPPLPACSIHVAGGVGQGLRYGVLPG